MNDKELYGFLTTFASDVATICDTGPLIELIVERAISLVGADEGKVYLETQHPVTDDGSLQLTAPLCSGEEVLGALTVRRLPADAAPEPRCESPNQHQGFNQEDERRLTLLASIASVAVAGVKRTQAIRQNPNWRDGSLGLFTEIGRAMATTLELEPLAHQFISAIADALDAEAGMLSLLDNHGHIVVCAVAGALDTDLIGTRLDLAHSVSGWVTRPGYRMLDTDSGTAASGPSALQDFAPRSLLTAPLIVDGQTIGAAEVAAKRGAQFHQDDSYLLESVSALAGAAVENCRAYERLLRRAWQQENIMRVGNAMRSADDFGAVLQEIVDSILTAIPTAAAAAAHMSEQIDDELELQCFASDPSLDIGKRPFAVIHRILQEVLASQQVENVADVLNDPRLKPEPGDITCLSLLVAPIVVDDKSLGTLSVCSLGKNSFGPDDKHMIHALAMQAAATLRNARLHSELEQRADELEAAYRELQELSLRKSQFVQNTSHELRTPLTFIRGYLEMLQEGGFGPLSDEQRQVARFLNQKSLQLVELVNDIASLTEVELCPEDIEAVDLVCVVAASVSARRERSEESGVLIKTDWTDAPIMVDGNQYRLVQICCHLLDNAIKFSPSGGDILVQVWNDQVNAFVRVSDQGIGIPPDEQKLIFERFYQIDGSTTRRFSGTGLGLAIVKETVEAHGGTVRVDSSGREGDGAAFEISLPLLKQAKTRNNVQGVADERCA